MTTVDVFSKSLRLEISQLPDLKIPNSAMKYLDVVGLAVRDVRGATPVKQTTPPTTSSFDKSNEEEEVMNI